MEKSGHTPARKKQNRTTCHASTVKARGANQDLLAALHVDKSFDCSADLSDLHRTVVTTNGYNAGDGHNKGNTSDDDDYHPTSVVHPPPFTFVEKKKIEPKIVLDCTFMTFLCPATFNNQLFCKCQPPLYSDEDISTFVDQFRKPLHFNFSATRNSAKQRESRDSTHASWLQNINLDVVSSFFAAAAAAINKTA
jgi:hypothetical protein